MTDLRPALSPLRIGRITGSRVGGILRLHGAARSRSLILRDMVREYHRLPAEFAGNEMTEWGQAHEGEALAEYTRLTGRTVHGAQQIAVHPFYDRLAHTPDGLVDDDGMVEVKCPWRAAYHRIEERPAYGAQTRLGLECTGRAWSDFVVWRPNSITITRVDYDQAWLPSVLPRLEEFLAEYDAAIDDPEVLALERGRGMRKEIAARERFLADTERWLELQRIEIATANEIAQIKQRVGGDLGDSEIATVDGQPRARWQYRAASSTFDRAAFRKNYPDLESTYSRDGVPTRYPVLITESESHDRDT